MIDGFVIKFWHRYGDYIDSQYHMFATGSQGGKITAKDICAVCYNDNYLMKGNDIERSGRCTGGKIPLHVCKRCFDLNAKLPISGEKVSKKVSVKDKKISKKRQMNKLVASGK